MNKKIISCISVLALLFGLVWSCMKTDDKKRQSVTEQAMLAYQGFLEGKISVDGIDIDSITVPTGEPGSHYETKYAFFDCDRNGVPELHVNSARYYYIFQYKDKNVWVYKNLSPYPYYYALQNGAFISHRMGAGPVSDGCKYSIFDTFGNEIFSIGFTKYDENGNGTYDEDDEYIFDDVIVTKDEWEKLTRKYLYKDEDGIDQIKNEISWLKMEF